MHGGGAVAAAQDGTDGDDHDIDKEVFAITRVPGIGEGLEVRRDGADVDELGHDRDPWSEWRSAGLRRSARGDRTIVLRYKDINQKTRAQDLPDYLFMRAGPAHDPQFELFQAGFPPP